VKKFTEKNLEEIINTQFKINWHKVTYEEIKDWKMDTDDLKWHQVYTTTEEKEKEFIEYLKLYIKPYVAVRRLDKDIWNIILAYWLNIKPWK